ncbi:hypothetical protein GCM10028819_44480 [Spirosoma humi]
MESSPRAYQAKKTVDSSTGSGGGSASLPARHQLTGFGAVKLDYSLIKAGKAGKFKTGRRKIGPVNSLQDWLKKFTAALKNKNQKKAQQQAQEALEGLRDALLKDSEAKLKTPKGAPLTGEALQEAQAFYQTWIDATNAHIEHIANEQYWLADFRSDYTDINDFMGTLPTKEAFLAKIVEKYAQNGQELKVSLDALGYMWERAGQKMRKRMEKLLGANPKLKTVESINYFLEAISYGVDPAEVTRKLTEWYETNRGDKDHLINADNKQQIYDKPFDEFLAAKVSVDKIVVPYYRKKDTQRETYKLTIVNNRVLTNDGEPLRGDNIYVLSGDGQLYGGPDKGRHHTSFLAGKPVLCAGHLYTRDDGTLIKVNRKSGHYEPDSANFKRAVAVFKRMLGKDTNVEFSDSYL